MMQNDGYTAKSISRKLNSIKTFYRYLRATGTVREDPAAELVHPKYEVKPPRILSKLEYRALRDACRNDVRISAIVELLLQTGLRIGELARLEMKDVDLKNNELHIPAHESHTS
jgi:site-specific recombinase XerD